MRKFLLALFLLPAAVQSQVKFEPGYFIDNANTKKECLIKNLDWKLNPVSIEYQENNQTKVIGISEVKEFSVGNQKKYVRATIKVDTSKDINSNDIKDKMAQTIAPYWTTKTVFVKIMVEGKMNLYSYQEGGFLRFYYRLNTDSITPLVYKKYWASGDRIGYNKQYVMQLEKLLDCGGLSKKIGEYQHGSLSKLVTQYNQCTNSSVTSYRFSKKPVFMAKATVGASYSSYHASVQSGFSTIDAQFESQVTPRFGVELELLLPYWNNRWSIIFDPNYRSYKNSVTTGSTESEVDYQSIELPIGGRCHFFITDDSQIFVDLTFVLDKTLGDTPIKLGNAEFDEKSSPNYGLGIGYAKNRLAVQFRYYSLRNIGSEYVSLNNDFKSMSFIASYRLFKTK